MALIQIGTKNNDFNDEDIYYFIKVILKKVVEDEDIEIL